MEIDEINEKDLPNTTFCYIKNFLNEDEISEITKYLDNLPEFIDGGSRYQRWYHQKGEYFCGKWKNRFEKWFSFDYDETINNFQKMVINKLNQYQLKKYNIKVPQINSCLINKYRNGSDYIRPHRDTHLTFGKYPTIINLSLGATRELLFIKNKNNNSFSYNLESGSLFIMAGSSQELYTHQITKSDTLDKRYSLTFRQTIN